MGDHYHGGRGDALEREVLVLRSWRHENDRLVAHLKAQMLELERRVGDLERTEPDVTRSQVEALTTGLNWIRGSYVALLLMLTTLFSTLFASGKL